MKRLNDNELEELKSRLTSYVQRVTTPDSKAGKNMYKCPLCGSGTHKGANSDGAFGIYDHGKKWKCHSCGEGGDIFNLIGSLEGVSDFPAQIKRASEVTGFTVTDTEEEFKEVSKSKTRKIKNYIEYCKRFANQTDYFEKRGFSEETVKRFGLGYDPQKQWIVIPYDEKGTYYVTRSVTGKKFRMAGGTEPIYNQNALYDASKPCFICESQLDAISIMQAGGEACNAIATGGVGKVNKLIEQLKAQRPTAKLILSYDNDSHGEEATTKTEKELKALNIPFLTASYTLDAYEGPKKDANELLITNREQLMADVMKNIKIVENVELLENINKAKDLRDHNKINGAERLKGFIDSIKTGANPSTSTGFPLLDAELDGGLYPGLYILGAISSLGKTTLMLQIADQIAQQGRDVLYFSLEMEANELISKSISRLTFLNCNGNQSNAKTARGICTPSRHANYSDTEKALIHDAMTQYGSYASHLYIYEGVGDLGVEQIKKQVAEHIELTNNVPLVFIDYLQILAPYDVRASDKQNTDKAVLELKRLSRDHKTPVIAISSFNRDNYTSEVSMSAFKESGAIEYGSDVLLALQPQNMKPGQIASEQKENAEMVKNCKASVKRNVEAVILKNRNGKTGGKVSFKYYSLFNCFEQCNSAKANESNRKRVI